MKGKKVKPPFIQRMLFVVLVLLIAVIAAGTAWALLLRPGETAAGNINLSTESASEVIFTAIGRLRIPLQAASEAVPPVIVITPVFPYNDNDNAFKDELKKSVRRFREQTTQLFAGIKIDNAILTDENAIKTELLRRYNSGLYLGKITTLLLTDFMIIE